VTLAGVAIAACGGDPVSPPDPVPTTISVSPDSQALASIGATAQFTATVRDQSGDVMNAVAVSWSSSRPATATIDGNGLATARADGQTTITATAGSQSAGATLTVAQKVATVTLSPSSADLVPSETRQFSAALTDANGVPVASRTAAWSTVDTTVAIVDAGGLVTAVADGQTSVIASAGAAADTAPVTVATVPPPPPPNQSPSATISTPGDGMSFSQGEQIDFTGSATDPEDGTLTGGSLVWESSLDGQIGTGSSVGRDDLATGTHTIRLIATDSQGAADTATISLTVNSAPPPNQPPDATINTPATGSAFSQSETVTGRGVAVDPEDGTLTGGSLVWESSLDGQIGTGDTFSLSILAVGTHTIRLIATDSQGAADTAAVTITVNAIPVANYDVEIRYNAGTTPTAAQQQAFDDAESRWEDLIRGDLPSIPINVGANSCGSGSPAITETVDDLLILVTLESIDGPGGILGSAGPCFIRTASNLPIVGRMRFDTADLASLESNGQLEAVILHEMGHVIGVGSLWATFGFRLGTGGPDPYFTGTLARAAFENIGGFSYTGGSKVPVANTGGGGTRDVHWRESVFDAELMTGFLDVGVFNPLSIVTVNSLADMGYVVNTAAADPLFLSLSLRLTPAAKLRLEGDVLSLPLHQVDSTGRVTRTIRP
jgi:hypothetical protein